MMFTGKTIALSEVAKDLAIVIVRDAQIGNVGKIPSRVANRLVYVGEEKYIAELGKHDGISAVIVPPHLAGSVPTHYGLATAENPHIAAIDIFEVMVALPNFLWEDFQTRIAASAQVHSGAIIADKNVIIGERTFIDAGTVVRERSIIGDDCYIGALSVIGAEAFEMMPGSNPKRLMKQAGGVRMESRSTVLSAAMIVRATFGGFTEIRAGACVDNLTHIAHDVDIGRNASVVACAEVSGRVVLGENSYVGPNACISNGLTIGANATITLGSVVVRDVPDDVRVTGNFAVPHRQWIRFVKTVAKDS